MSSFNLAAVSSSFKGLLNNSDTKIEEFLMAHTGEVTDGQFTQSSDGTLILSAGEALQLQQLMADESIAAQTGTSVLKSVKDSISAAARNI